MVVMDPYEILCRQHWRQLLRKHLIDAQIAGEIAPRELEKGAAKKKERKKRGMGETKKILIKTATGGAGVGQGGGPIAGDPGLTRRLLSTPPPPAKQNTATLLQSGAYRDGKSS